MRRCLFCYQVLEDIQQDFHPSCSKRMFGEATPPSLPYTEQDLEEPMTTLKVDEKQQQNIFSKMERAKPNWIKLIEKCFLSEDFKVRYIQILTERFERAYR